MAEMIDIIKRLIDLTSENRAPWKPTANSSTFAVTYGDLSLLISSRMLKGTRTVRLSVLDGQGNEIDYAVLRPNRPGAGASRYKDLPRLFDAAKKSALGVEEKLNDLLDRMNESVPASPE